MYSQLKHVYSNSLQTSKGLRLSQNSYSYELFTYSIELVPDSSGIIEKIINGNSSRVAVEWDIDFFVTSIQSENPVLDPASVLLLEEAGLFVSHEFFEQKNVQIIF